MCSVHELYILSWTTRTQGEIPKSMAGPLGNESWQQQQHIPPTKAQVQASEQWYGDAWGLQGQGQDQHV